MRSDVEALNGALRAQKGFACFNYAPGVADRDTLELLLTTSAETVGLPTHHPGSDVSPRQGVRCNDDADLRLILAVLRAFQHHETTTGARSTVKPLRETLFFRWEGPRLPPGGKHSPLLPHSPGARDHRAAHGRKGLVYDHVSPVARVIRELLQTMPNDEQSLRQVLDGTAERVIITKAEDDALNAAGYRDTSPDPADPWSRYQALGLQRSDFAPFVGA